MREQETDHPLTIMRPATAFDTFDKLSLAELHKRTSEKWSTYPPEVLPAFVAEMDFPLAPPVRAALLTALDNSDCGYAGTQDLGAAFAEFAAQRFGWNVDAGSVFGIPDVMAGVAAGLRALTKRGDGVVINPPVYPPFFEVIRTIERSIIEVPLLHAPGTAEWTMDFDALEKAFADGARAFLLCSPHNPVGRVWLKSELQRIEELARRYGVTVLADEIHSPLTIPAIEFVPYLTVAKEQQPSLSLCSASKAWNIAGLKCGVMVTGSDDIRKTLQAALGAIPTEVRWRIGQLGARASAAAFREGGSWLDALRAYLERNGLLLARLLSELIPKARYSPPQATYLAWIDCGELGLGENPARLFLERGRVALEPGRNFGKPGSDFVRLNMGTSSEILTEIVQRMARSL